MAVKNQPNRNRTSTSAAIPNPNERPNVSGKIRPQVNRYYLKIAKRYQTACACAILFFLLYLVVIIGVYGNYITYDNLQYLVRDFDTMLTSDEGAFSRISYNQQSEMSFARFKGGLAVAGKESFSLFDSSGLLLCEDALSYTDPVLEPSEKYLLLYDLSGRSYSVYNSLTRVISRQTDYKISDGDMSDSGAFVLVTRSHETKYVVEVYNAALNRTMSIYKDNYVMDTAISKDGNRVMVCSAIPGTTDFNCEVALYESGSTEMYQKTMYSQAMPLYVKAFGEGFALICDNGIYLFDKDGVEMSRYGFSGMTLSMADISDSRIVVTGSENALGSENRVLVLDSAGTLLYNGTIRERVAGICAPRQTDSGTLAYFLTPDAVIRLSERESEESVIGEEDTTRYETVSDSKALDDTDVLSIHASGKGVVVCTSTGAYDLFSD